MGRALHQHLARDRLVDPGDVGDLDVVDQQVGFVADHDGGLGPIDLDHVPLRATADQTKALALTDGHQLDRLDPSQRGAGGVDDPRRVQFGASPRKP